MRVEMHQGERPAEPLRQGTQQRQGDAVLSPQREQVLDAGRLLLDALQAGRDVAEGGRKIADVGEVECCGLDPECSGWSPSVSMRLARRIACGPSRAPARLVVPMSSGMPATTYAASRLVRVTERKFDEAAKVGVSVMAQHSLGGAGRGRGSGGVGRGACGQNIRCGDLRHQAPLPTLWVESGPSSHSIATAYKRGVPGSRPSSTRPPDS